MGAEIELKLALTPAALAAVLKSDMLKGKGIAFGPARRLATTYFDTPKHALRRKDIFVRVRKAGRRFTQTVKTAGEARLLAERPEWEWPLKSEAPDLALAATTGLKALEKRARKNDLAPVFVSDLTRRVALVSDAGSEIELALDIGEIRAGRRIETVRELELELKHGSTATLFDLARALVEIPGVTISVATKAGRGFALAEGSLRAGIRAAEPDLSPDTTPHQAAAAILDGCAVQAAENLPLLIDRRLPEAVHQLRVAMRRQRAALIVFKAELPPEKRKWLKAEAGWLADAMGPARDLDVMTGETLKAALGPTALTDDMARLRRELSRARRAAWAEAIEAAASPRAQILLLEICRSAALLRDELPDLQALPLVKFAAFCLEARMETVLALGQTIDQLHSEARHSLRLALKKLRYAADFFEGLFPKKKVRAELKALGRLQDAFGGFNDAAVVEHVLQRALGGLTEKRHASLDRAALFVSGWAAHRGELAWADARRRWEAFAATEPFWRDAL